MMAACRCPDESRPAHTARPVDQGSGEDPADRPSSLLPPAREPGPARAESEEQVARAGKEATAMVAALRQGGITGREVTSMADIRGYRLFKRRYFRQARAWFEAAVKSDPTFEPALYNAARSAAAMGDRARAAEHLRRLSRLETPLARSRLQMAARDPDLASLFTPDMR